MTLNQIYVISYMQNNEEIQEVCYYEPNADVNSPEFKKEFELPENTEIKEIPQEQWTTDQIKQIMDMFFDDNNKSGCFFDSSNYEEILKDNISSKAIIRNIMLDLLKLIHRQYGY